MDGPKKKPRWDDDPPGPEGPAAPPTPDHGGPETPTFSYDKLPAAASGGHNWFSTALVAVGKFFALLLRHWRWDSLAVVLCIAYGAYLSTGDRSILLWRVTGIGFAVWFIVVLWAMPEPKNPVPVTPPPGTGWQPEGDGGQEILNDLAQANAARAKSQWTFWSPLRPVFRTSRERLVRLLKKAGKFMGGLSAEVWAWLVAAGQLIAGLAAFITAVIWEIGKVIFTKPIDQKRPWDKRKPSWVVIGVLATLIPLSVLVGMNLPRAGSAGKEMLAGMSHVALPKLPDFRWPTWGAATPSQVAQQPVASSTVTPKLPPTAFGNGFRRKPDPEPEAPPVAMAAAPLPVTTPGTRHGVKSQFSPPVAKMGNDPTPAPRPLRSVKAVDKAVRQVEAEADRLARDVARAKAGEQFRRERETALAKAEAEDARKAAEAKALAATRQRTAEARRATPAPKPTVLVAGNPTAVQSGALNAKGSDPEVARLQAELARAQKERDEAQARAKALAARPVPTPVTITRTVSVPGPARTVYRDRKIAGPVRVVRQTVEVKVPVVKTVTKTKTVVRTKIVRVPGPTRTRVVEKPVTRVVTQTVKIPVQGPERVVYRDRVAVAPVAASASAGKVHGTTRKGATDQPKLAAKKTAVAKAQPPVAPKTTANTDPYGGDPYDY